MNNAKQLKIGVILSYLSIFINIASGLIYTPWMIRQIGSSDYALYTLANSLITLFLVDFGLSAATSRYISKYRAEGDSEKVSNFLGALYKLYLLITGIIFVVLFVLYFFIDSIYTKLTPDEISKFKVVYIISASFAVINFPCITFNGILTAYEKFISLKVADIVYRISFIVSTVLALAFGRGLYALVALHALVGLSISLFKLFAIKRGISLKINFRYSDRSIYKEIFSFSIWVTISSLATRLIFNIIPSILGIVADSSAIAVFGVVTTIEAYIYTVVSAINGMFMPTICRVIEKDERELNPLFLKVGRSLFALNGVILCVFFVVGELFISLWMGKAYTDAYIGLLLIIIPGLFYNPLQIANTTIIATKKTKIRAYIDIIIGVLNILFAFPLSKYFGVIGACISICIVYMIRAIVLNIVYHKVLPLDMLSFAKRCYGRMSLPVLFTILLGLLVNCFWSTTSWVGFTLKSIMLVGIYIILLILLGVSREEKRVLHEWIKHRLGNRKRDEG